MRGTQVSGSAGDTVEPLSAQIGKFGGVKDIAVGIEVINRLFCDIQEVVGGDRGEVEGGSRTLKCIRLLEEK